MGEALTAQVDEKFTIEQEELRGISRTVAEIEWLLLILVLLYQVFEGPAADARAAIGMALFFYAAFVLSFHFIQFYKTVSRGKIALETWAMIIFITWAAWFTGRLASPLLNAYLLVIITSALTLGKIVTLFEVALVAACFILLGDNTSARELLSLAFVGGLAAQLAPMLLVAYVTTMFSADIRYGLNRAKLLSETDDLTGVYNRRGFAIAVDRLFAQSVRYNRPASLLMIDSDNLKMVNDTHGHEAGNALLKLVTKSIATELRHTDVLARYGGDEFLVLLPETGAAGALDVAERIRSAIAATPLEAAGTQIMTSVSIGVAGYPEDGRSIDTLLARADRAMYEAKQAGRNRVTKFAA
ncbi:MAG: GGDEF domain-containing protein [Betaproteobacteria bacterium]|nr:GGDEF domain-containing protein [Betaproteobacteria bacterium]